MATTAAGLAITQVVNNMDYLLNNTKKLFPNYNTKFLESEVEIIYKCHIRNDENGDYEMLPKTAEWFREHKILPHVGDTVIPIDLGPAKKPFCSVASVIWDTNKNEVIILLVKEFTRKNHVA